MLETVVLIEEIQTLILNKFSAVNFTNYKVFHHTNLKFILNFLKNEFKKYICGVKLNSSNFLEF